ncbi:MAG: TIGR01777 family oxidoreductase, partial [Myxococcota bacterium]
MAGGPILVSGATGLLGGRLSAALQRDGLAVRALTRDPEGARRRCSPEIQLMGWDGVHPPPEALAGARAVVHLAGAPVFAGPLTRSRRRRIYASRIDSTRAIAAALEATPGAERPAVLVCASAVGFYGSRGEEPLDETSPAGRGFFADLCGAWEAAALAAEACGVRTVCLRIGIVLAREGGALRLMARVFRLGLGGRLGNGEQWFPWVHADDVAALIRRAVSDAALRGPVNAVAPVPVRNKQLTRALAAALGRPALLPVPAFALRAGLGELSEELL